MSGQIQDILKNWLKEPREAAKRLTSYYGEPDEFSENYIIWHNTKDGWKRTVLENVEIPHNFPSPHNDCLEQFINYNVPVDKYSELAEYDGSLIVERTRGEVSARCGGTSMNFVAVNLAHDIVTGERTVEEAREEYTALYKDYFDKGLKPPATQRFLFDVPHGNTGDPDLQTLR